MIKFLYLLVFTVSRAAFGEGAGPVLVHGVSCTGTESSLLNCSHQIGVTYCSHFYDVGVVCPPCKSFLWHKFKGSHSWTAFTVVLVLTTVDIVKFVQYLMHCKFVFNMLTVETPDNIVLWSNFTLQAATYAHSNIRSISRPKFILTNRAHFNWGVAHTQYMRTFNLN